MAGLDRAEKVRYRIYRSSRPISDLKDLRPLAEVKPLSCWNGHFNGGGDPKETDVVPRYVVENGQPALPPGTGLYVHTPVSAPDSRDGAARSGVAFYAVTYVLDGVENRSLDPGNCLKRPVAETPGPGAPVLQRTEQPAEFNYVKGPTLHYFSDVWYLRKYPERETGFVTWSNGKNDGGIGWRQAVELYRAMQETRRPHLFVWGQSGHGQRAVMPGGTGEQRNNPLDLRTDQSLPAFTRCSLDENPGQGDPEAGDPQGAVNYYLLWDTADIVDEERRWEMTLFLAANAPQDTCTVDLTPRRLQHLRHQPGDRFQWTNRALSEQGLVQSGDVRADPHGLLTLEHLQISKKKNRIRIER